MSIKLTFVFGLLLASGWTQDQVLELKKVSEPGNVSEPVKISRLIEEASVEAKAETKLGNEKIEVGKLNKEVDENVEKTENGVKASASASVSFNFEEFLAKWLQDCKQNKENNNEGESNENEINEEIENEKKEKNKVAEDKAQSEENQVEDVKSPFIYTYNVHARASASGSSSSSSSSSFYFNFNDPLEDGESNENKNAEIQDENAEAPQESDDVADDLQKNFEENEQPIDVENVEVPEHCNQQNSENKEPLVEQPLVEQPLQPEDETQVEEVEQ